MNVTLYKMNTRNYVALLSTTFSLAVVSLALFMADTYMFESIRIGLVIGVQVLTGGLIWSFIDKTRVQSVPNFLGLGLAIGSGISLLAQQLLRQSFVGQIGWICPSFIVLFYMWAQKKFGDKSITAVTTVCRVTQETKLFVACCVSGLTLALSYWWFWLLPLALGTLLILVIAVIEKSRGLLFIKTRNYRTLLNLGFVLTCIYISNYLQGKFKVSYVFSHDQVFSESLSWSLVKFGSNESPFEAGSAIRYHWFSLGWAGVVTDAAHASNWTVVTKLLPILSFLGIISLIWSILEELSLSLNSRVFGVFVAVLVRGLSEFTTPIQYFHSPTFLFGSVWMLAAILVALRLQKKFAVLMLSVFSFLIFGTFGGKFTNGIILVVGLLVSLSLMFISNKSLNARLKILFFMLSIVIATCIAYVVVFMQRDLTSNAYGNEIYIEVGGIGVDAGFVNNLSGRLTWIFGSIVYLLDMPLLLFSICILWFGKNRNRVELWLLTGITISGVGATMVLGQPGASQMYFLMGSLIVSPIAVAWCVDGGLNLTWPTNTNNGLLILAAVLAAVFGNLIWSASIEQSLSSRESLLLKSYAVIVPLIVGIVVAFLLKIFSSRNKSASGSRLSHAFIFFLAVLTSIYGLGARITHAQDNYDSKQTHLGDDQNQVTGSRDHLEILHWIRTNTDETDVVATNRFCIPDISPCISKWQLVSAVSHRRMFVEGGYWVGASADIATKRKVDACIRFAANPTLVDWSFLIANGVDYFFVDHAVSPHLPDWKPYATEILSNKSVTLLRLNVSLALLSTGG